MKMKTTKLSVLFLPLTSLTSLALLITACGEPSASNPPAPVVQKDSSFPAFAYVRELAGSATSEDTSSSSSFNVPVPTLTETEAELHATGDVLFSRKFNTEAGVGPAFN